MSNYREQGGNLPSQFRSTRNVISWKQEEIKLPGNALVTVHFDDTKPNMFMLQNPNETVLHIGITKIPTEHTYEFKIDANNSATFGRPVVTDVLYILNKANVDATVSLFSVADDFDMSILQSLSVDLSKSPTYDGIIKGFTAGVSLPSGTNHIGNVDLTGSLPTGTNNIGKVGLTGAIPEGTNKIGKVDVEQKPFSMMYFDTVTESILVELSNRSIKHIVFLANDSEGGVTLYLKKPDGNGCRVYLKGGEKITDIPFEISSIRVTGDADSEVSFRYLLAER